MVSALNRRPRCAAKASERAATYAGDRFRALLEDLAVEWQARGKTAPQIVAGFADRSHEVVVVVEQRGPSERRPIAAGRSAVTADFGSRALAARTGTDRPSETKKRDVVRRGVGWR